MVIASPNYIEMVIRIQHQMNLRVTGVLVITTYNPFL